MNALEWVLVNLYMLLKISWLFSLLSSPLIMNEDTMGTKGDWTVCAPLYLCRVIQTKRMAYR